MKSIFVFSFIVLLSCNQTDTDLIEFNDSLISENMQSYIDYSKTEGITNFNTVPLDVEEISNSFNCYSEKLEFFKLSSSEVLNWSDFIHDSSISFCADKKCDTYHIPDSTSLLIQEIDSINQTAIMQFSSATICQFTKPLYQISNPLYFIIIERSCFSTQLPDLNYLLFFKDQMLLKKNITCYKGDPVN